MASIFRKSLGCILLLATIGLVSCQSLFHDSTEERENITVKMP